MRLAPARHPQATISAFRRNCIVGVSPNSDHNWMSMTATLMHGDIEKLAYRLWEERGRPIGSSETDWFRAERILTYRAVHPVPSALPCRCDDVTTQKPVTDGSTFFLLP